MGQQIYGYTRGQHEYSVSVPQLMTDDGELTICMSAHGGGTVGESYAGNGWDYAVYDGGTLVLEGSDLRSAPGRPSGHAEMARTLAAFLSAYGEAFWFASRGDLTRSGDPDLEDSYAPAEREWLASNYERLGLFAADED